MIRDDLENVDWGLVIATRRVPTVTTAQHAVRGAVLLARDGTSNRSEVRNGGPYASAGSRDFGILPDASPAVARFRDEGYPVIVITSQPHLSTGRISTTAGTIS